LDQTTTEVAATPAAILPPHLLAHARVLPGREDILPLLPKNAVIAEVGVAFGDYSNLFLKVCEPSRFLAIDNFTLHEYPFVWGLSRAARFGTETHEQQFRRRFAAEIADGRMEVLAGDSVAMLNSLPDASLDVVYLDAEHSYASVKRELAAILPKIRADGWLILNDYTMADYGGSLAAYGVIQAAHEFMIAENWEMQFLALHPLMYCDIALRKFPCIDLDRCQNPSPALAGEGGARPEGPGG